MNSKVIYAHGLDLVHIQSLEKESNRKVLYDKMK